MSIATCCRVLIVLGTVSLFASLSAKIPADDSVPSTSGDASRINAMDARLLDVERRLEALERVHADASPKSDPQTVEHNERNPFEGAWVRPELATNDLPKVVIARGGNGWTIRAWGDCEPTDCDWGTTELHLLSESVGSRSFNYGFAKWDQGFKDSCMVVHLDGDQLLAENYSLYKDGSGRSNTRRVSRFDRAGKRVSVNEPDVAEEAAVVREPKQE